MLQCLLVVVLYLSRGEAIEPTRCNQGNNTMPAINDWYNEDTLIIPATLDGQDFEGWCYSKSDYSSITVKYGFGYNQIEAHYKYNSERKEWERT